MKKIFIISLVVIAFTLLSQSPIFAQTESKSVILTVSGSGKTQQEALAFALRNAIEQAFGTFISSNTKILNDDLIKDEIVSVSSGNIQDYAVISEVNTPDGNWSNTVRAKVSVDKLTSFCESKGVVVEFKGGLFALNIKQQKLNEENEEKVISNMLTVLKNISENCFDYEIKAESPIAHFTGRAEYKVIIKDMWDIPITIYAISNTNIKTISEYFASTIKGLSLNDSEIDNYRQVGKEIYCFEFETSDFQPYTIVESTEKKKKKKPIESIVIKNEPLTIALRSEKSLHYIGEFMAYFSKSLLNFKVDNNVKSKLGYDFIETVNGIKCILNISDYGFKPAMSAEYEPRNVINKKILLNQFSSMPREINKPQYVTICKSILIRGSEFDLYREGDAFQIQNRRISFKDLKIGQKVVELRYKDMLNTDEISKISEYKIAYCKNMIEKTISKSQKYIYKAVEQ